MAKAKRGKSKVAQRAAPTKLKRRTPKQKCCASSTKCGRCPLRMLKEGTLPPGYTVRKRRLVVLEAA